MPRSMDRTRLDLAAFVRAKRARLSPADAGLSATARRRTPGLRREEVAALARVGVTWYTWFEQGRDIKVSEEFLLGVAKALRLDDDECRHLFMLAHRRPPAAEAYQPDAIGPALQAAMDVIAVPAMMLNLKRDILGWNSAAAELLGNAIALHDNLLRAVFLDRRVRAAMPRWRDDASALATAFRHDLAIVPDDPLMRELEDELSSSSVFRASADPAVPSAGQHGLTAWGERRFQPVPLIADVHRHLRIVMHLRQAGSG